MCADRGRMALSKMLAHNTRRNGNNRVCDSDAKGIDKVNCRPSHRCRILALPLEHRSSDRTGNFDDRSIVLRDLRRNDPYPETRSGRTLRGQTDMEQSALLCGPSQMRGLRVHVLQSAA